MINGKMETSVVNRMQLGCRGAYLDFWKRMYVRGLYRKKGVGKSLCAEVVKWAAKYGYNKILLDTNQEMIDAVLLYESFGFSRIAPYCVNENANPIFMQYLI